MQAKWRAAIRFMRRRKESIWLLDAGSPVKWRAIPDESMFANPDKKAQA
jgi:hypothetical protein